MSQLMALLVTSGLLLLPLIPAAILYYLLSPKRARADGAAGNRARGEIGAGSVKIFGFRIQFNVVGSTATYVVLLGVATIIHGRLAESFAEQEAVKDRQQAWLVEVPVRLKNSASQALPAEHGEMQQIRVELEPALTQATANTIQFWVVPNNGKFPTARFNMPQVGVRPAVVDLNDIGVIRHEYVPRRMTGIAPVWIEIGDAYDTLPPPAPGQRP